MFSKFALVIACGLVALTQPADGNVGCTSQVTQGAFAPSPKACDKMGGALEVTEKLTGLDGAEFKAGSGRVTATLMTVEQQIDAEKVVAGSLGVTTGGLFFKGTGTNAVGLTMEGQEMGVTGDHLQVTGGFAVELGLYVGGNSATGGGLLVGGTGKTLPAVQAEVDALVNMKVPVHFQVNGNSVLNTLTVAGAATFKAKLVAVEHADLDNGVTVKESTDLLGTLHVSKDSHMSGKLTVDKAAAMIDTLHVDKATHLKDTLTVHGATVLEGECVVRSAISVGDQLTVSKGAQIGGNTHVHGGFRVDKNGVFTGDLSVGGALTVSGDIIGSASDPIARILAAISLTLNIVVLCTYMLTVGGQGNALVTDKADDSAGTA